MVIKKRLPPDTSMAFRILLSEVARTIFVNR